MFTNVVCCEILIWIDWVFTMSGLCTAVVAIINYLWGDSHARWVSLKLFDMTDLNFYCDFPAHGILMSNEMVASLPAVRYAYAAYAHGGYGLRPCTHWQFYPTRVPFAAGCPCTHCVHCVGFVRYTQTTSGGVLSGRERFAAAWLCSVNARVVASDASGREWCTVCTCLQTDLFISIALIVKLRIT